MTSKTFRNIPKEKQDRVLRAAQVEFAKSGFHKTNINDICKRAGISNGALYKYFRNKADLYRAVIEGQVEGKDEYMRGVLSRKATCLEKIRLLMENTETEPEERNDTFRIILQLGTSDMNSFSSKATRRMESTSSKNIRAILAEGVGNGEIRSDIDMDMVAYTISSLCFFFYSGFVSEYHRVRIEEFLQLPFTEDATSQKRIIDRMMKWLKQLLEPSEA